MRRRALWILFCFMLMDFTHASALSPDAKHVNAGLTTSTATNPSRRSADPTTTISSDENDVSYEPVSYFDNEYSVINVTAHKGHDIHLDCHVNNLNGKTVSWVRRKGDELNLLTVGNNTYSADARYTVAAEKPDNWQLFIRDAGAHDEGSYECQVSSHPPIVIVVHLFVVVPHIEIEDERGMSTVEKFYKVGSTIKLKCVIENIPERGKHLTWKHGKMILNHDTTRGGINIRTELQEGGKVISRLFVANANRHDTGNYTCSLDDKLENTVLVHILVGENPAAMQASASERAQMSHPIWRWLLVIYLLCCLALQVR